ncbi:MAG TPA: cyclase family protein [Thermoleophilia bacterium]|nr:cyclase family protein [Thermoleophilia bacterium]
MTSRSTSPQRPLSAGRLALVAAATVLVAGTVFVAAGCGAGSDGASPSAEAAGAAKTVSYSRVVELSQPISPDIPLWPGDPAVVFKVVATMDKDGYYLRSFSIGEHSATHMNAPNSFVEGSPEDITSYPAEQRVVPAVVVDVRPQCAEDADYRLSRDDVLAWEKEHGEIAPGSVVLMLTGWQDLWDDPQAFLNLDDQGELHFPGFDGETTTWLMDERDIAGVGIDTHGVDAGTDESYATNMLMAENHKIALECLGNLDQLPPTGATLVLGALQLVGGSGTPLSVVALVP